jgi:hypothetical protein
MNMKKTSKPVLELITKEQEDLINESLGDVMFNIMKGEDQYADLSEDKKNLFAAQIENILSRVLVMANQKIIQKKTFEDLRK